MEQRQCGWQLGAASLSCTLELGVDFTTTLSRIVPLCYHCLPPTAHCTMLHRCPFTLPQQVSSANCTLNSASQVPHSTKTVRHYLYTTFCSTSATFVASVRYQFRTKLLSTSDPSVQSHSHTTFQSTSVQSANTVPQNLQTTFCSKSVPSLVSLPPQLHSKLL